MKYDTSRKATARVLFLIILHASFLPRVTSQPRLFEGVQLQCCTLIEGPMIFEDPTRLHMHGFNGIGTEYLSVLEDRLGFRCKTLNVFNASNPDNQGFTGFIYEMEKCAQNGSVTLSPKCQCQIGVGGWAQNAERFGRVDFPSSYVNDDYRMLTHVDNINARSARGAFFITAFSFTTWLAVFGLILCFIFLKLFDKNFIPPDPKLMNLPDDKTWTFRAKHYLTSTKFPARLKRSAKNTLLEIIGQSTDELHWDSTNNRQWIITYIVLLCGLFLVLAYEATMTASLVQERAQSDFRTLNDLKHCRVSAQDVCVPRGGAAQAFWESTIASSPCHRGASPARLVDSYTEGHYLVATKQCKFFLASGANTKSAALGQFCNQVEVTGEPFFITGSSFVLPKGSNMTEPISRVTLELRVADEIDSVDAFLRRFGGECAATQAVSLNFSRLKIFFITAYAACLLMFFLVVCFPLGKRKMQQKESVGLHEPKPPEQHAGLDSYSEASYSQTMV